MSLLNTGFKLISKVLAKRIKKLLSSLIWPNQTTHLENRFISEGRRLISDILKGTNILKVKDFLLGVDLEAFDLVNHLFIFHVLEKFGFGKNPLKWIKSLLINREPRIINKEKTTMYLQDKEIFYLLIFSF